MRIVCCDFDKKLNLKMESNSQVKSYQYKVIYLGDSNAGKTSLFVRLTGQYFYDQGAPTLNVDLARRKLTLEDGSQVSLQLWDTPGQEIYRSLVRTYYRNALGVFLCLELGQKDSKLGMKKIQHDLVGIESWMTELGQTCTMQELVFCFLGTKIDLGVDPQNRQLILTWIEKMKIKYALRSFLYFETSALEDIGIKESAVAIATLIKEKQENSG